MQRTHFSKGQLHNDDILLQLPEFISVLLCYLNLSIPLRIKEQSQEKITDSHFLEIFGYLKNTHKNPKFGRVRQVPIWELGWEFPGWDLSHFAKFGIFMGIL